MTPNEVVGRVQRLLLSPGTEWDTIDNEGADVAQIYQGYILPLVGIAAIAQFIGLVIAGAGLVLALEMAILYGAMTAAMVYVVALIINALAPQFGAKEEFGQAFKVAAYSPTPIWVALFLSILPLIGGIAALIGLAYSLYLLYLGLPKLMKAAADKALIYTLAVIGCELVIGVVLYAIIGSVLRV